MILTERKMCALVGVMRIQTLERMNPQFRSFASAVIVLAAIACVFCLPECTTNIYCLNEEGTFGVESMCGGTAENAPDLKSPTQPRSYITASGAANTCDTCDICIDVSVECHPAVFVPTKSPCPLFSYASFSILSALSLPRERTKNFLGAHKPFPSSNASCLASVVIRV